MSTSPLTIYLPLALSTQIKLAAKRNGQSQSAYVTGLLERHFNDDADPLSVLIASQLSHLIAASEEWADRLPVQDRKKAKERIDERAKRYKNASLERLKS